MVFPSFVELHAMLASSMTLPSFTMVFPSFVELHAMLASYMTLPSFTMVFPSFVDLYAMLVSYLTPPSLASLMTMLWGYLLGMTGQTIYTIGWYLSLPMITLITTTVRLCKFVATLVEADPLWAIVVFAVFCVVCVLRIFMYDKENVVGVFYMMMFSDLEMKCKRCETHFKKVYTSLSKIFTAGYNVGQGLLDFFTYSAILPVHLCFFLVDGLYIYVMWPISVLVWMGNLQYALVWAVLSVPYVSHYMTTTTTKTTPAPAPASTHVSTHVSRPFREPLSIGQYRQAQAAHTRNRQPLLVEAQAAPMM
jgi:hypothetical protein